MRPLQLDRQLRLIQRRTTPTVARATRQPLVTRLRLERVTGQVSQQLLVTRLRLERVTARVSPRLLVTPRTTTPVVAPHIQQTGQ